MTGRVSRRGKRAAHLSLEHALDYLEGHLGAAAIRAAEEHLASPCETCHERVRDLGRLLERMHVDRAPAVPAAWHQRAVDAFPGLHRVTANEGIVDKLARLVFDSMTQPLPARVRRAVGEARRIEFELGPHRLELECESEGAGSLAVRGRLAAPDPGLYEIEFVVGAERMAMWPDALGAFVIERIPLGSLEVTVRGPDATWSLPVIEMGRP